MAKCEVAKNVQIRGEKYKIVNPKDPCSSVNKVLAKHEVSKVITPNEYDAMLKGKEYGEWK